MRSLPRAAEAVRELREELKDVEAERNRLIRAERAAGATIPQVAAAAGLSLSTVNRILGTH